MTYQLGNTYARGRPKAGKSLTEAIRVALAGKHTDGRIRNRVIAEMLVEKACGGDIAAIREVLDRTEGKAIAQLSSDQKLPRSILIQMTELDLRTA